jgi:hypothetical protein
VLISYLIRLAVEKSGEEYCTSENAALYVARNEMISTYKASS